MRVEISSGPGRGSARSRTDDGPRAERLLIDQIDSGVFAAFSDMALRLRQARDQSDFQLAGERKESDKQLPGEQSARNAAVAALADREELLAVFGQNMKSLPSVRAGKFFVSRADWSRPGMAPGGASAS